MLQLPKRMGVLWLEPPRRTNRPQAQARRTQQRTRKRRVRMDGRRKATADAQAHLREKHVPRVAVPRGDEVHAPRAQRRAEAGAAHGPLCPRAVAQGLEVGGDRRGQRAAAVPLGKRGRRLRGRACARRSRVSRTPGARRGAAAAAARVRHHSQAVLRERQRAGALPC